MATTRYYLCPRCQSKVGAGSLFDALLTVSKSSPRCESCASTEELHVVFEFGLEAGSPDCKILHSFLPQEPICWSQADSSKVTFYPFLVILQRADDDSHSFWLPYWHVVENKGTTKKKYGQWAPFMDACLFESLVGQAREKGYLPASLS